MRTKQERAEEFARQHGESKKVLEPSNPQDWFVRYELEHSKKKTPSIPNETRIDYVEQIQYELYRPWPGCSWPQAWRVCISEIVLRKDLEWDHENDYVDFSVWGQFCESKEEALASARHELRFTPTF